MNQWADAINLAKKIEFKFPNVNGIGLKASIPDASPEAIELITEMLRWDPNKRPTTSKLLSFPFFSKINLNTKISMILNETNEGQYNNSSMNPYSNDINIKKSSVNQADDSEIDKCRYHLK